MTSNLVKVIANFETSIVNKLESSGTTFELVSNVDDDGNTLPAGTYAFTLSEGESNEEHIVGTLSGSTVTITARNVKRNDGSTAQTGKTHRKGSSVKITNFIPLKRMMDLLDGTTDFDSSTPLKYDGAVSHTTGSNEFATIKYADDLAIAGSPDITETTKGIGELATTTEINAGTENGSTGAKLLVGAKNLFASIFYTQLPSSDEKDALAGTGTPSSSNKFVNEEEILSSIIEMATDSSKFTKLTASDNVKVSDTNSETWGTYNRNMWELDTTDYYLTRWLSKTLNVIGAGTVRVFVELQASSQSSDSDPVNVYIFANNVNVGSVTFSQAEDTTKSVDVTLTGLVNNITAVVTNPTGNLQNATFKSLKVGYDIS